MSTVNPRVSPPSFLSSEGRFWEGPRARNEAFSLPFRRLIYRSIVDKLVGSGISLIRNAADLVSPRVRTLRRVELPREGTCVHGTPRRRPFLRSSLDRHLSRWTMNRAGEKEEDAPQGRQTDAEGDKKTS